ncbi:MAG TPA: [Fe-Fe] hydrogenase large subunit C-terminal domain-containing protein [Candidatus Hydrogenedentes bacterium]|nr:[Fe-Fe] hydrogenase large subunit C-terminal domain-containing protein [Candidatus Hydrogenedentota bacterium]
MNRGGDIPLVTTIRERCRMCYTCVRECPAKAIRISDGQAEVISQRCIACGNCVRVCSQGAKSVWDSTGDVFRLLVSGEPVAAIIAPSFPAEFSNCTPEQFVSMVRALGFAYVHEVSFGADLVATAYRRLLERDDGKRYIATNCPAIIAFVERYYPEHVDALAPIVSPMIATARVLRKMYKTGVRVVFVGPCIAKKGERLSEHLDGEVDEVLTFLELRQMFEQKNISPDRSKPSDFDGPHGGPGALFPISRGLLQAADIPEDLAEGLVVAADGRAQFVDAVEGFAAGQLEARLLEVLACSGCINGPGVSRKDSLFIRRNNVSKFVRERMKHFDWDQWRADMQRFHDIPLDRTYAPNDQRMPVPTEEKLREILRSLGKNSPQDELNCGACGYDTCREHAIAICNGLAENTMCLPHTILQLRETMEDLAVSRDKLAETREALLHSERLAGMGQLAAGIAHELNNPLGIVLMYAHLLKDERPEDDPLQKDLELIAEQADRCKKIVAGLLHFARQNKVSRTSIDVRDLVTRAVRACPAPENICVEVVHEVKDPMAMLDRDQMLQVLTNLIGNAFAAMPKGGKVTVKTVDTDDQVGFVVSDTGVGIPASIRDKIFEPFFTTKEVGKGTGLGLAVSYGIVKMHRGSISVESNDDPSRGPTGTTFKVMVPRTPSAEDMKPIGSQSMDFLAAVEKRAEEVWHDTSLDR